MKISFLDLSTQYQSIANEIDNAVLRVLRSQQYILGPDVYQFEQEISNYCGTQYAIACASGSDAIFLSLLACGVGHGDEVITTPYTFFATAGAISRLGARPVFVDMEPGTYNMNPGAIDEAITYKTVAIMPVHLFGQCSDMSAINEVAARHRLPVIEDAAQAIGATHRGGRAGTLGLAGAFSFYPSKNLGGAGDGGIVTTNHPKIADRLKLLRAHGARDKYHHEFIGINSRLDSIQAAILRVKLRHLDRWADERKANAARYRELFRQSGLVESEWIQLPLEVEPGAHVYNQFVIRARDRDPLREFLREKRIGTEVYYPLPLHLQPCFKRLGYSLGDLPESERAARQSLALPIYPELGAGSQERIVDAIKSFYD